MKINKKGSVFKMIFLTPLFVCSVLVITGFLLFSISKNTWVESKEIVNINFPGEMGQLVVNVSEKKLREISVGDEIEWRTTEKKLKGTGYIKRIGSDEDSKSIEVSLLETKQVQPGDPLVVYVGKGTERLYDYLIYKIFK